MVTRFALCPQPLSLLLRPSVGPDPTTVAQMPPEAPHAQ